MILIFHIFVALASLVAATASYAMPSRLVFKATYALTAAMLASGTILVIQDSTHLVKSCAIGLGLLVVILYQVALGHKKLAAENQRSE